jgi:pyruvate-formate lyase-activating enzyme
VPHWTPGTATSSTCTIGITGTTRACGICQNRQNRRCFDRHRPPPPLKRRVGRPIWDGIDDNALLLRVIFREPTFPELADELWSAITANAYQRFAAPLRAAVDAAAMQIADPEAAAAV